MLDQIFERMERRGVFQVEEVMTFPLIIVSMLIKMYSSVSVPVPFCAEPHPSTTTFPPL